MYDIILTCGNTDGPLLNTRTSRQEGGWLIVNIIEAIEKEQLKADKPKIEVGDYVKVHVKIKEGNRERIQVFEGTVIRIKGSGSRETFTVRRVSYGVGVERIFPIHSPNVERVETVRKGKVRRAKLYYLRKRVGKAAKVKTKLD